MKHLLIAFGLMFMMTDAKAYLSVDLNEVCANNDGDETKAQQYRFGNTSLKFSQKSLTQFCELPDPVKGTRDWRLNVYFGPFLAFYNETEVALNSNGKDFNLSHVSPIQRHSMQYYNLSKYKHWTTSSNPAQMFDEPQNRLTIEYQNVPKAFSIGIEYIHPKIIFYNTENAAETEAANPEISSNLGTEEKPFYLASLMTTKSNVIFNLYMNKRFQLINIKDKFKVEYIAGAGIGVHGSESLYEFRNDKWEREQADTKWNVQGYSGTLQNRLELSFPKARVSLRLSHDIFFIRYDAQESGVRMKANLMGQFVSAQLGFNLIRADK